jgi:hypothetical protein
MSVKVHGLRVTKEIYLENKSFRNQKNLFAKHRRSTRATNEIYRKIRAIQSEGDLCEKQGLFHAKEVSSKVKTSSRC